VLDAAVDRGAEALDRARQLEVLETTRQVPEDHLELQARDVGTQADVLPDAEGEVAVGAAIDAEREGIVEDLLVAVRGREVERELLAGADLLAAQLVVLARDPGEVGDRRDPAQDLLDRRGKQIGVRPEPGPLAGMLAEGEQAPAEGVAGGLVARLDEELRVLEQDVVGNGLPFELGAEELADQVVRGLAAPLLDELLEVRIGETSGLSRSGNLPL
jgi:hypothetical protein